MAAIGSIVIHSAAMAQQSEEEPVVTTEGVIRVTKAFDISTEVDNRVVGIHFVEGQPVKKGDLLAEFDSRYFELDVRSADAARERAAVELKLAEETRDRLAKLRKKDTVSEAEYLAALREAEAAAANLRIAEIDAERARTLLEGARVHAPFDGQMSAPNFRENSTVEVEANGQVATLYSLDPIHFRFEVPYDRILAWLRERHTEESLARRISLVLKHADGEAYDHTGRLINLSFAVDPNSGNITGLAEFANPDRVLRPGMKLKADAYWKEPSE